MISQTAEYALRAIVFLADNPSEAQTAEAIAKGTKVPVGYLAKIMQGLARSGLVTSQRGLYGGFTLVLTPKELSVYDVIQAVDPIVRIAHCPLGLEGHGTNLCPLHRGHIWVSPPSVIGSLRWPLNTSTICRVVTPRP